MKSRGTLPQKIEDLSDKIVTSVEKQDESLQIVKLHNAEAKTSWANAVKMGLESTNSNKAVHHPESTKNKFS